MTTDPRTPVTVITGCLGSGKTTLLQQLMQRDEWRHTAVIINELGETGLDHLLVQHVAPHVRLLKSGCLCCSVREDLTQTLADLLARRRRQELHFDRVVVETTGLADPLPVMHTLTTHASLVRDFRLAGVVTVVDTFSRFSPVIDPRFTYRSENVVEALDRACAKLGYPKAIRVDQGTEFVSRDLDLWAYQRGVTLDFSRPGKPTDNSYIESFNGKFRAECLNQHRFLSLDDARQKMEEWRRDYNEVRPHSAIGNKPPISLMNASGASGPP